MTEKQHLRDLEDEKQSLARDLRIAVERSDGSEIARLKQRQSTIDSDLFAARVQVIQAEIRELEAQQTQNFAELREAKASSTDYDSIILPKAEVFRAEAQRISNESLANIHRVKLAEQKLQHTAYLISQTKDKLSKLLS